MKIKTPMSLLVGVFFSLKLNLGPKIRSDIGNLPVLGAEPRSGEAKNSAVYPNMLRGLDSNQDAMFQRHVSYH